MSARFYHIAWRAEVKTQNQKMVLLRLVEASDEHGLVIYGTVPTIATQCMIGERTVQLILREFENWRLIFKVSPGGRGRGTQYQLNIDLLKKLCPPERVNPRLHPLDNEKGESQAAPLSKKIRPERVQNSTLKGAENGQKGESQAAPIPYIPLESPSARARARSLAPPEGAAPACALTADEPSNAQPATTNWRELLPSESAMRKFTAILARLNPSPAQLAMPAGATPDGPGTADPALWVSWRYAKLSVALKSRGDAFIDWNAGGKLATPGSTFRTSRHPAVH